MTDFHILKLEEKHLLATAELEKLCFAHPWTAEGLKTLISEGGVGFAAIEKASGRLVSYAGMIFSAYEGDITDVATHPDFRRRGLSNAVMDKLIEFSRAKGLSSIALEVRVSNLAAISLYEGLGFEIAGKRLRFYRTPPEDAYVMIKQL